MSIVFTEDRGSVRHVILNRPEKRNAMNQELLLALGEALREAAATRKTCTASCCAAKGPCSRPESTSSSSASRPAGWAAAPVPQSLPGLRQRL